MAFIKVLWGLIINLDLIAVGLLSLGLVGSLLRKSCSLQPRILFFSTVVLIFTLGDWPYSGRDIIRRLENYYPTISIPQDAYGMIILGSSYCLFETEHIGKPVYHKTSGRLIEALNIAKANPNLKIILVGSQLENKLLQQLMLEQGISKDRLIVDADIMPTSLEDAIQALSNDKDKKWLLVTSAYNMPRAVQIFSCEKWNIIPCPVDYHTVGHTFDIHKTTFLERLRVSYLDRLGFLAWNTAWREIAGLVNLRLCGKTSKIFP